MAANAYSALTAALVTELAAGLSQYTGLVVARQVFQAGTLANFARYSIIVSPPANPWEERRIATPQVMFIMRADLWLLIKNYGEASLWGTTAPDLGLFQMVEDVKTLLRLSDLGGLVGRSTKTYDEPAGPLSFEWAATMAFESEEKTFVHRAKLVYTAQLAPFCHPRL